MIQSVYDRNEEEILSLEVRLEYAEKKKLEYNTKAMNDPKTTQDQALQMKKFINDMSSNIAILKEHQTILAGWGVEASADVKED